MKVAGPHGAPAEGGDGRSSEEVLRSLVEGRLPFHRLPAALSADEQARVRRRALEEQGGTALTNVAHYSLDAARAAGRHCENFIGVAQVPMGIAGPLRLKGEQV